MTGAISTGDRASSTCSAGPAPRSRSARPGRARAIGDGGDRGDRRHRLADERSGLGDRLRLDPDRGGEADRAGRGRRVGSGDRGDEVGARGEHEARLAAERRADALHRGLARLGDRDERKALLEADRKGGVQVRDLLRDQPGGRAVDREGAQVDERERLRLVRRLLGRGAEASTWSCATIAVPPSRPCMGWSVSGAIRPVPLPFVSTDAIGAVEGACASGGLRGGSSERPETESAEPGAETGAEPTAVVARIHAHRASASFVVHEVAASTARMCRIGACPSWCVRFVRLLHAADRANALARSHLRRVRGRRYHPDGGDHRPATVHGALPCAARGRPGPRATRRRSAASARGRAESARS